jgi:hypothetical protein
MNGEGYYYRALATLNEVNSMNSADRQKKNLNIVRHNVLVMKTACSDFEKAKEFQYSKSYKAIQTYCNN